MLALLWPVGEVILVRVLAPAAYSPCVYVEALTTRKPPHANFLRTSGHKAEGFALTLRAVSFGVTLFVHHFFVSCKQVAAEASRVFTNSEAIVFGNVTSPGNINSAHLSLLGMIILPLHHFLGSNARAD